jgi:hypothetical protein
VRILEVEAGDQLFVGLLDGVVDLCKIDFGDDIESVIGHGQKLE